MNSSGSFTIGATTPSLASTSSTSTPTRLESKERVETVRRVPTFTVGASSLVEKKYPGQQILQQQRVSMTENKNETKDETGEMEQGDDQEDYEGSVQDVFETTYSMIDMPDILSITDSQILQLVKTGAKMMQQSNGACCCKSSLSTKQLLAAVSLLSFAAMENKFAFETCGEKS